MTNYYTYTEEIRDEDVPNEIVLKKHTLPQLPEEIISMILYKFGGLQHKIVPTLRMVRELAFKEYDDVDKEFPLSTIKYKIAKILRDKTGGLFKIKKRYTGPLFCETTTVRFSTVYRLVNRIVEEYINTQPSPLESYTYWYHDEYIKYGEPRVGNSNIKYKNASVEQIVKYWKRHLVSNIMSVKQLKELLDMNDISYTKSATKKKLLEKWYGF